MTFIYRLGDAANGVRGDRVHRLLFLEGTAAELVETELTAFRSDARTDRGLALHRQPATRGSREPGVFRPDVHAYPREEFLVGGRLPAPAP